ncbi:hypothetical protein JEM67_17930 [Serratia sp. PAMC26656]|uniref:hypothetical protein n=1 Tax=Serratia sp. PAMC26656 TaxID=2775909 RepID=UPI0018F692B7|nr:hypothetical protein [Serratia sp. PAMC26656]MBJ7889065.1 hypothetical protein [Serratia sp. PAMC26656]
MNSELDELPSVDEELTHELRYAQALSEGLIMISQQLAGKIPVDEIELGHIYYKDSQEASRNWRQHGKRQEIDLEWWRERRNQTKRIDVSIRCRHFLCGLMLARRSRQRLCVTLRYLEGNPNAHPLKGFVMPIALIIAESFAMEYDISQVNISRPAKELIKRYQSFGYALDATDKNRVKRNNKPRAKLMIKTI